MSADSQMNSFSSGMADLTKAWPNLTLDQRRDGLQALVTAQAKSNGFPAPALATPNDLGHRNGELRSQRWQIAINPQLLQGDKLSSEQAAKLGDTVYHETRHAEQWYLMARRESAEGVSRSQLENRGIKKSVAKQAISQPLTSSDCRRPCADALYRSVYGSGSNARTTVLRNLGPTRAAYDNAVRACEDAAKTGNQAEIQRTATELATAYRIYQETYTAYRALPEEADAWDVGGRVNKKILENLKPASRRKK